MVGRLRGDSLAERSKAPDSSSGGAIRVGSNPTAVKFYFAFPFWEAMWFYAAQSFRKLLWLSWSARQPNKLKVRGSSPRGSSYYYFRSGSFLMRFVKCAARFSRRMTLWPSG